MNPPENTQPTDSMVKKAMILPVIKVNPTTFRVEGATGLRTVIRIGDVWTCNCASYANRLMCSHIVAASMYRE